MRKAMHLLAGMTLVALLASGMALAAAGVLDRTFGRQGKVLTNIARDHDDKIFDVSLLPSGKIVATGDSSGSLDFPVARYLPDGSLDTSFGGGDGKSAINFGRGEATALSVQPDGKLVVAGNLLDSQGFGGIGLVRYLRDGTLDKSFGGDDGKVIADLGERRNNGALDVALQGEKIVVAGFSDWLRDTGVRESDFVLIRYHANGTLDNTFGRDGVVTTDLRGDDYAYDLAVQQNGKLVLAGTAWAGMQFLSSSNFALARYLRSGAKDITFGGGDGEVITDFGGRDQGSALILRQDATSPVVAGYTSIKDTSHTFALAAYEPDGSLDKSFGGGDGKVRTSIGGSSGAEVAYDLTKQSDGKLVVAGTAYSDGPSGTDLGLVRYLQSGGLDKGFGGDGRVTTNLGGSDGASTVVVQPNGKVLAAGWAKVKSTDEYRFALARYLAE